MKKILFIIFALIFITSPIFSQTAKDLFKQAVSFYTQGEYNKALDMLNKIDSPDINTEPLRKEIQKKLNITEPKKETQKNSETNIKSDQDLFNEAVSLYNAGRYEEALRILKNISDTNINTQSLITEINKKIKAKEEENNKTAGESKVEKKSEEDNSKILSKEEFKSTEIYKSGKNKTYTNQNLRKEENAIDLTTLDLPNNNKRVESSPTSNTRKSEIKLNEENKSNFPINKYLLGVILFFALSVIGFVMIKNKTKNDQRALQFISLSSNKNYNFNKHEIKIGKAQDNDFVINHEGISRYHAVIRYDKKNNRFLVRDLGSINGTLINGKKIRMAELKSGDIINFYKISFKVTF